MKWDKFKLGATGAFPRGKAGADDEGEIRLALAADYQQAIVRIEFGTPVAWLGLSALETREFAALLIKTADDLDRRRT